MGTVCLKLRGVGYSLPEFTGLLSSNIVSLLLLQQNFIRFNVHENHPISIFILTNYKRLFTSVVVPNSLLTTFPKQGIVYL